MTDYFEFGARFGFLAKSRRKASEGSNAGEYPFYRSSPILDRYTDDWDYSPEKLVFGTGGNPSVHYASSQFSTSTDCLVAECTDPSQVYVPFIYYYLNANMHLLEAGFRGAALKHISKSYILSIPIPSLDLADQRRRADLFDIATGIRNSRQQAIGECLRLTTSAFSGAFGDCLINASDLPVSPLEELAGRMVDCPHSTPKYATNDTGYFCVRSSDIQDGYIDLAQTRSVTRETYEERILRYEPKAGDVVYTREGGRLGNAAQIPHNARVCLGQRMLLLSEKEGVSTNEFIWALLNSDGVRDQVNHLVAGAAAPRINISDLRALSVTIPSFSRQQAFSALVSRINELRARETLACEEAESLIGSLSQRYLDGGE